MKNKLQKTNFQKSALTIMALFGFLFLFTTALNAQITFFIEDFETDGDGTRYEIDPFIDLLDGDCEDFFGRIFHNGGTPAMVDLPCIGVSGPGTIDNTIPFGTPNGNHYISGEDMNDIVESAPIGCGNGGSATREVVFTGINISGATDITVKFLLSVGTGQTCNTTAARWDETDGIKVLWSKDGGGETTAMCFAADILCGSPSTANEPLKTDPNCTNDGAGGTNVPNAFTEYSFTIPAGGSALDLIFEFTADAGDEEFAFDFVRLEAMTAPAPIELASFNAQKQNQQVELLWTTISEINNDYFSIEHSTDGDRFEVIGKVAGAGNSFQPLNYSFTHDAPNNGVNYYRLKQTDFDATFSHSRVAVVEFDEIKDQIGFAPNPFEEEFTIKLNASSPKDQILRIFDMRGKLVYSSIMEKDQIQKTFDLNELNSGIYLLTFDTGNQIVTEKIVKF